jgi:HPt (histidine-containing phosphotransfer) domain-containing protein
MPCLTARKQGILHESMVVTGGRPMSNGDLPQSQEDLLPSRMDALRERFRSRVAEDRDAMTAAWARADHRLLRARAHRLAGVAATFGYPEVGDAAKSLENLITAAVWGEDIDAAAQRLFVLLDLAGSSPE